MQISASSINTNICYTHTRMNIVHIHTNIQNLLNLEYKNTYISYYLIKNYIYNDFTYMITCINHFNILNKSNEVRYNYSKTTKV